jgi:hypothetical protein
MTHADPPADMEDGVDGSVSEKAAGQTDPLEEYKPWGGVCSLVDVTILWVTLVPSEARDVRALAHCPFAADTDAPPAHDIGAATDAAASLMSAVRCRSCFRKTLRHLSLRSTELRFGWNG